jgi:hypothetical protein
VLLPSSEVGQAISRKSWRLATFPRFNGLDGREKWRLREQTWKSSLRRNKFLPRKYRNHCRAILPCDPKFFHPRVNALRTAKVRAPPRVYVAALKFGLAAATCGAFGLPSPSACAGSMATYGRTSSARVLSSYCPKSPRNASSEFRLLLNSYGHSIGRMIVSFGECKGVVKAAKQRKESWTPENPKCCKGR